MILPNRLAVLLASNAIFQICIRDSTDGFYLHTLFDIDYNGVAAGGEHEFSFLSLCLYLGGLAISLGFRDKSAEGQGLAPRSQQRSISRPMPRKPFIELLIII